jgi:DNA-binding MarR family transcriptional regulator
MECKPEPHDLLVALLLVQSLLERRSEAFFQPFGLSSAQFNILNLLAYRDGRMDQSALVELLLVGKSSVSIVLNRMVRDGLVKREEHPRDRRQVVLLLTAKGLNLWRKISPLYENEVREAFGSLPVKRRQRFIQDLEILYDALKRNAGAGSAETSSPSLRETMRLLSAPAS